MELTCELKAYKLSDCAINTLSAASTMIVAVADCGRGALCCSTVSHTSAQALVSNAATRSWPVVAVLINPDLIAASKK